MYRLVSFFGDESETFKKLNKTAEEYAKEKGIEYIWAPQNPFNQSDVIAHLNDADAGLIDVEPYNDEIFNKLNDRCKLLIRFGVGFDKVDLPAASRHGICVTRTTGANKTSVAEMAMLMIMASMRKMRLNRLTMESGVWTKNMGVELAGKKVGILGFGNIGVQLSRYLSGFNCDILVYDVYKNQELADSVGARYADLDEIFTTCDAISIHLPYNSDTHHLVNSQRISTMKPDAVIVCTARGNIVDEDALYDALKDHRIGGAALDVYATEPYPSNGKLMELDNIILTPHISSQTFESLWNIYKKAIDIADDFFAGRTIGKADLLNPDYKEHLK